MFSYLKNRKCQLRFIFVFLLFTAGTGLLNAQTQAVDVRADSTKVNSSDRYAGYLPVQSGETEFVSPSEEPDSTKLPILAIKVDLVYGLGKLTPNLSGEVGLGKRTTLELSGSNNRWNRIGDKTDNKKFVHWTIRPEFRYWLDERFRGHFFGVNATYWQYNISGHNLLWMFKKDYRYNGRALGGGITYGYNWRMNERWGAEFAIGLGVAFMNHDKFECRYCGDKVVHENRVYFGPTRVGISLVYHINRPKKTRQTTNYNNERNIYNTSQLK